MNRRERVVTFAAGVGSGLLVAAGVYVATRPSPGSVVPPVMGASTEPPPPSERELARELCAVGDYEGCLSTLDDLGQQDPATGSDPLVQRLRANAERMRSLVAGGPAPGPEGGSKVFDPDAAKKAVTAVTDSLSDACSSKGGPNGAGHVTLTLGPSGAVTSVELDLPFDGTPVGRCITTKLRAVRVAPFEGEPRTVSKNFFIR